MIQNTPKTPKYIRTFPIFSENSKSYNKFKIVSCYISKFHALYFIFVVYFIDVCIFCSYSVFPVFGTRVPEEEIVFAVWFHVIGLELRKHNRHDLVPRATRNLGVQINYRKI